MPPQFEASLTCSLFCEMAAVGPPGGAPIDVVPENQKKGGSGKQIFLLRNFMTKAPRTDVGFMGTPKKFEPTRFSIDVNYVPPNWQKPPPQGKILHLHLRWNHEIHIEGTNDIAAVLVYDEKDQYYAASDKSIQRIGGKILGMGMREEFIIVDPDQAKFRIDNVVALKDRNGNRVKETISGPWGFELPGELWGALCVNEFKLYE